MNNQTNIEDITLVDKYVNAKKIAYTFYHAFSQVDDSKKIDFIKNICDELKEVNESFYDDFVENIITNTLLYPNDYFLLKMSKTDALIDNVDKILSETNIGIEMLRLKSREFQLFNYSNLFYNDVFKNIDYDNFPIKVDDFCKNYISGNLSIMKKNKNK